MLQFVLAFEYNLLIGSRICENANQYMFFQCFQLKLIDEEVKIVLLKAINTCRTYFGTNVVN